MSIDEGHHYHIDEGEEEFARVIRESMEHTAAVLKAASTPEPEYVLIPTSGAYDILVSISEEGDWAQLALVDKDWDPETNRSAGRWTELDIEVIPKLQAAVLKAEVVVGSIITD